MSVLIVDSLSSLSLRSTHSAARLSTLSLLSSLTVRSSNSGFSRVNTHANTPLGVEFVSVHRRTADQPSDGKRKWGKRLQDNL